jgi:hypothetical protein
MERSADRRKSILKELADCPFEEWRGIDGANADVDAHWEDLQLYFRGNRLTSSGFDSKACRKSRADCDKDASPTEQRKIALDLTYILLFRRIAKLSHPAVIFEDDITTEFQTTPEQQQSERTHLSHSFLLKLMSELPRDWDLFLLYSSAANSFDVGPFVSPRIRVLRSGVGTVAFAVTPEMARRILSWAERGMPELYVDLLVNGFLAESGLANAYVAWPFVVQHHPSFRSSFF